MGKWIRILASVTALSFFVIGCSLNPFGKSTKLSILFEGQRSEPSFELQSTLTGQQFPMSAPNDVNSFHCYGINVMGPGIGDSGNGKGSSIPYNPGANVYCSYPGITSPPIATSTTTKQIDLMVPTGPSRIIQIVGVIQGSTSVCSSSLPLGNQNTGISGNDEYYEIGHIVQDIFQSTTVTVPDTYPTSTTDQAARRSNCGRQPVAATAGQQAGCISAVPPGAAPGATGTLIDFFPASNPTAYTQDDGVFAFGECNSYTNYQWSEFQFNVSNVTNPNQYSKISALWKGRAGYYSHTCYGASSTLANTALNAGGGQMYIYRFSGATAGWYSIGSATSGTVEFINGSTSSGSITDYISSNVIYIGFAGGQITTTNQCSSLQTDFIGLGLEH